MSENGYEENKKLIEYRLDDHDKEITKLGEKVDDGFKDINDKLQTIILQTNGNGKKNMLSSLGGGAGGGTVASAIFNGIKEFFSGS